MNKVNNKGKNLQKNLKTKGAKIVKKSLCIYFFILGVITSIASQVLHCIFFYYCRAFFVNIIEDKTMNFFFDVEQYILMILFLILYGIIVHYLHTTIINKFVKNKKNAFLLENILLSWKYFVFLIAFLVKMFIAAYWSLAIYLWIVTIILWQQKRKKTIIGIYSILIILHIVILNSVDFSYLHGVFLMFYSSIYFAIEPCYETILKLKKLLKSNKI